MRMFLSFVHTTVDHSESGKKDNHHSLLLPTFMRRIEPQQSSYVAFNMTENLPQSNADQNSHNRLISGQPNLTSKVESRENEGGWESSKVKQVKLKNRNKQK